MVEITTDFLKYGCRELKMARELLTKFGEDRTILPSDGVQVFFNTGSGNVFLCDEDLNVAMMNGDDLELFYSCPYCGHEGFLEEMYHEPKDEVCKQYMKKIGVPEFAEYEEEDE